MDDNLTEFIQKYEIYDAHAHVFPQKISKKAVASIGNFYGYEMTGDGSSSALIKSGSEIGVKKYVVCSTATTPAQVESINSFIKSECDKHSEFIGFGSLHPDFEDVEGQVDYCIKSGLKGIKLHNDFQQFNIDDKKAYKIYEACRKKLPILFHMGDARYDYSSPVRLKKIAEAFPDLMIIAAHFGGHRKWDECEILKGFENIFFDSSSSTYFLSKERTAELINSLGVERVFFGVDFPMWNHTDELSRIAALNLPDNVYRKLFSENLKNFFK